MRKTGVTDLPLHYGKAPRWLFEKMKFLAREVIIAIVSEKGPEEFLRKISDPLWFQALGCVLGFDWHSSGLTTTTCGAIKEAVKGLEKELGVFVAGGKGKVSLNTPLEITQKTEKISTNPEPLIYASRMAAKVDTAGLQDYARRYHWIGEKVKSFVCEPHLAICSEWKGQGLNMVAKESEKARKVCTELSREKPSGIIKDLKRIQKLKMPTSHSFSLEKTKPEKLEKTLHILYEKNPKNFEEVLETKGVGVKTIRALALVSDLIYGAKPSFKDPATYSFAHGGKDGHPYPVDKKTYTETILTLHKALREAKIGRSEKIKAIKRLRVFL